MQKSTSTALLVVGGVALLYFLSKQNATASTQTVNLPTTGTGSSGSNLNCEIQAGICGVQQLTSMF
jgi:hypothetical protein